MKEKIMCFNCPNCQESMYLEQQNSIYNNEKYDKWCCHDCMHIIVLDFRGEE